MSYINANAQGFTAPDIIRKQVAQWNIVAFGATNTYPQQALYLAERAGIATACIEKMADFIFGQGFKSEMLAGQQVNGIGETANEVLSHCVKCFALNRAFFLHVGFMLMPDASLAPASIQFVDYEQVRFANPVDGKYKKVKVWDDWANASPKIAPTPADMKEYSLFGTCDPAEEAEACGGIEKYNGQILYFSEERGIYPASRINPVWEEVASIGALGDFTEAFIQNGFSASTVLVDRAGNAANDETRRHNENQVRQLAGSDNAGAVHLLYGDLENLEISTRQLDKDYDVLKNSLKQDVIERFSIPPILLGREKSGGGFPNKDEMENAYLYYNGITRKYREAFERQFKRLFTSWAYPISTADFKIEPLTFG
jgi:hypothetical protein